MYTKRIFPLRDLWQWTRRDIYKFFFIALVPVSFYTLFELKFLTLPWLPIALVGTALAFIVGFKNNVSYDRLWEARKIWGGIVNTSRSWGMLVNDLLDEHNDIQGDKLAVVKKRLVYRHIAWMTAHRYTLRGTKPWEQFAQNVSNKEYSENHPTPESKLPMEEVLQKYLSPEDFAYVMQKGNKATHLLSLQSKELKKLKDSGVIWEFSHLEMEKLLVEMFTLQGKNERIKNFPYPRQFATLNYFFVWIFVLLLPYGVMGAFDSMGADLATTSAELEKGWFSSVSLFIAHHFVWLTIPFCIIISWVFHTMERVGEVSENPFEGTANDIPITTMSRGIEIDLLEMLDLPAEEIPAPIPAHNHIQM